MNLVKKALFSAIPLCLAISFGELTARVFNTSPCQAIVPDAGDWETMRGDPNLLWRLEPNTEFKTGRDITRINAIGLRESLLPTQKKRNNERIYYNI